MRTVDTAQLDLLERVTGLPRRYLDSTVENFRLLGDEKQRARNGKAVEQVRQYLEDLEGHLRDGRGLYLSGPLGVGKTRLITAVARAVLEVFRKRNEELRASRVPEERWNGVRFLLASRLSDYVYPPRDAALPEGEVRRQLFTCSALVLDDLTKLAESRLGGEVVFLEALVRSRYHSRLPTFYTSQVPLEDAPPLAGLGSTLKSKGLEDLIVETSDWIKLFGPSERRRPRGE